MPEPRAAGAAPGGSGGSPMVSTAGGWPGRFAEDDAGKGGDPAFWRALALAQGDATADGTVVVTDEGRVQCWSARFPDLWELSEETLASGEEERLFEALAGRVVDAGVFRELVSRLSRSPREAGRDEVALTDGRVLEQVSIPIEGPDGALFGRVWAYRDLTQQKRLENAHGELLLEQAAREAASQRSARLRALHEAALTMNAVMEAEPGSIAPLLTEIMRRAVAALSGRDGRIVLTEDAAWRDLTPESGPAEGLVVLDHTALLRRQPLRSGGGTEHVLRTGEMVQIHDTQEAEDGFGPYPQLARHGIRAMVIVPLRIAGRTIGAFSVTFARPRDLRTADREAVELFAGHAAAALERARLLYAERRRAQQAERLAATLATVAVAPDLVAALEALLRGAISLLDGDDGTTRLYGPGPGERLIELGVKDDGRLTTRVNPPPLAPETFSARMQTGGPSVLVTDFLSLDPTTYAGYQTMKHMGMRSAVLVPIDTSGGRIGSLAVNHRLPGYFGPGDLALAEALAAQAGAVIERARLDTERQAAVRAREAARDELAKQSEELARREAEAAALRELDRLKNELLTTMSHELRTPLTVVHGYAQHLLTGARHLRTSAIERIATLIFANSRQLVRLVQDMMDFARLGRGEVPVQPVAYDLVPQLDDLLFALKQLRSGDRLVADLPATAPVFADGARVEQIVSNLVDNALKYAPEGPITIRVSHAGAADEGEPGTSHTGPGEHVRVEVLDEGAGIPRGEQHRVWEKLYRGSAVAGLNTVRGSGIGLAVVKALVEAQRGQVGLESEPGRGSRFWFTLPTTPTPAAFGGPGAPAP